MAQNEQCPRCGWEWVPAEKCVYYVCPKCFEVLAERGSTVEDLGPRDDHMPRPDKKSVSDDAKAKPKELRRLGVATAGKNILNMGIVNQAIEEIRREHGDKLNIVGLQHAQAMFIEGQLKNYIQANDDVVIFLLDYLEKAYRVIEKETLSNALVKIGDERVIDALILCLKKNGEEPLNEGYRDRMNEKIADTLTRITGKFFMIGNQSRPN